MDFVKKHLTTIISIVAIVALFLPFATVSPVVFGAKGVGYKLNGFGVSFLLIIPPVLLIIKNFIPQIKKYSQILSIGLPILAIAIFFISMLTAKVPGMGMVDTGNAVKHHVAWEIGAFIALISYLASLILGLLENKLIPEKYIPKK